MPRIEVRTGGVGSVGIAEPAAVGMPAPSSSTMPILAGTFARFNEWSEIADSLGHYMERIAPGAFAETIRTNRARIKVLFNHGGDPFIGSRPIAALDVLGENAAGGYYAGRLFGTMASRELVPLLEAGVLGSSFRFSVPPGGDQWVRTPAPSPSNPDGIQERTVRQAILYELGPVVFPAYSNATAGLSTGDHPPRSARPTLTASERLRRAAATSPRN